MRTSVFVGTSVDGFIARHNGDFDFLPEGRIHTVWRKGVAKGPVIRVTPGLYNTNADIDALVAALHAEHAMCL
jgi:selenocysteine lyase/cysteine desulfurase